MQGKNWKGNISSEKQCPRRCSYWYFSFFALICNHLWWFLHKNPFWQAPDQFFILALYLCKMLQIKGLQVTDGSVSSLKVVPTGVVQEMRCAGSLSLQAWGAQRSAKAGCGEEEHLRISVVQAGGQWLAGGTHKKKHRNDGKNKSTKKSKKCVTSHFWMSKHGV